MWYGPFLSRPNTSLRAHVLKALMGVHTRRN